MIKASDRLLPDGETDVALADLLEMTSRQFAAGEEVDLRALCDEHPELADELTKLLPTIQQMARLADNPRSGVRPDDERQALAGDVAVVGTLGDYEILDELGRGGMGVVYRARQKLLARDVAVKILPMAALGDRHQLARFRNEVRATAALHHPHIVPIHTVGVDRGIHYYAMQYIDGPSLAQVIRRLKEEAGVPDQQVEDNEPAVPIGEQDTHADLQDSVATERAASMTAYCRTVAQWGRQVAQALAHAHENGVVHRDIKPANLFLDQSGSIWVADFGLARLESSPAMTHTGDVVGTLRYMAPEQALGKHVAVDHRADIYSLGAALYELLTLMPVHDGETRHELLRQIAVAEPRRPRRIEPAIPRVLETIVLKAIEKDPADRYGSAGELADELGRFLDDKPISARRPGLVDRGARLARRHKGTSAVVVAMLIFAVICLAISTALVGGALSRTRLAQEQTARERDAANYNLYVADMRLAQSELDDGHLVSVHELLDGHVPEKGAANVRGWEWYYLKSLCHRDLVTLGGHSGGVSSVAWSPDGRLLATGSVDFTIKIWDATTMRLIATLTDPEDRVTSVAWSPDGQRLASLDWDNIVRIWDATTWESILEIPAGRKWYLEVRWSPDGTRLAAGGGDGLAKVWDARTGAELLRLKGRSGLVWCVAWSPDGQRLATVGNYGSPDIRIWDAETGQPLREVPGAHHHAILSATWSPDGGRLATSSMDQAVKVWNTETWKCTWNSRAHHGAVNSVSWSPDGKMLATAGADGTVKLWDARSGEATNTFLGHRGDITAVAWRPDGQRIATASSDNTAKIWDPVQEQPSTLVPSAKGMAWSPDGRVFATVAWAGDEEDTWQLQIRVAATGRVDESFAAEFPRYPGVPRGLAWSPQGTWIAADCQTPHGPVIRIFDLAAGTEMVTIRVPNVETELRSLAWSPDGRHLAAAMYDDAGGSALVWDVSTGERTTSVATDGPNLESVAWSQDGTRLATADWSQDIRIFDTSTWEELKMLQHTGIRGAMAGGERMVAWSPDGRVLAAGSAPGWVILWETASWRELRRFSAHTGQVRSIAFNPDGSRLVTCSQDRSLKVWDTATGAQLLTLHGNCGGAYSVAWSPDGKRILSHTAVELRIWDATAGYVADID